MTNRMSRLVLPILFVAVFAHSGRTVFAQTPLRWSQLAAVDIRYEQDQAHNRWVMHPQFSDTLQRMVDQPVYVTGYLLPVDVSGGQHVLSAFPFASCFFCGGAGPESVIELRWAQLPGRLRTDQYATVQGRWQLLTDGDTFLYRLENARIVP